MMKITGALLACVVLAGCADINDIRAEPSDLSVTVHATNISKFTDCLRDELLTTSSWAIVLEQSVDRGGITHIGAHLSGRAGEAVYIYDVTVSPLPTPGNVVVERHSKKDIWGGSNGPPNLKEVSNICAE